MNAIDMIQRCRERQHNVPDNTGTCEAADTPIYNAPDIEPFVPPDTIPLPSCIGLAEEAARLGLVAD